MPISPTPPETWSVVKARLQQRYATLTDNDPACIAGREEEMIGPVQDKIGASRDDLMGILHAGQERND